MPDTRFPSIGNFSSKSFHPQKYKFIFTNPAFDNLTDRDGYWGAKIVVSFTDEQIEAAVKTGQYSNPKAAEYLISVLKERRDIIGDYWFHKVNPLDDFRLEQRALADPELRFTNLAVKYGLENNAFYRYTIYYNREVLSENRQIEGVTNTILSLILPDLSEILIDEKNVSGDGILTVIIKTRRSNNDRWLKPVSVFLETGSAPLFGCWYKTVKKAIVVSYSFIKMIYKSFLLCILISVLSGCSQKGLLEEGTYNFTTGNHLTFLPEESLYENPTFVFYSDSRPGLRIHERSIKRKNWLTWKMLIVPFYELYWLGNGFLGTTELLRRSSDYGKKERAFVREAVNREIGESGADFIFSSEFVIDGRYPSNWIRYLEENSLSAEIPVVPVVSNHDIANDTQYGLPNFKAVFKYPNFFTMQFPDALLIVTDSNIILDQNSYINDSRQNELFQKWLVSGDEYDEPAWLERVLSSTDKKFKILSMHHSPVSFGFHRNDWEKISWGSDLTTKRSQLLTVLQKYGVQVVLCGH